MKALLTAAAAILLVGALSGCDPNGSTPGAQGTSPAQVTTTAGQGNPGPGTTAAKATTTTAGLPNRDDANVDARDFQQQGHYYFQSPSKNIKCGIDVDNLHIAGCQLKNATAIPSGLSCANNPAHEVAAEILSGGTKFECLNQGVFVGPPTDGSTAPGNHEGGGKVLEYGRILAVKSIICESMTSGVRCSSGDGHGFFIAAENQYLF
ncbi:hypothetical protein [Nocardia terrae]|uniref:hypothetical protein n=1 Tax=Nocardia terrae TaxID=2675851 RepID=UPI0018DFE2DD|nr:hypothetical protein [Nocardia terrae]